MASPSRLESASSDLRTHIGIFLLGIRNAAKANDSQTHQTDMKKTQVVSGFLLTSLLFSAQISNAVVVFDDGETHTITDNSLQFEFVEVLNGSTLRLEPGAVLGGSWDESGTIVVYDTSTVEIAGAILGSSGGSSGSVFLFEESQLIVESGSLGADGPSSGQVNAFDDSSVVVLGGSLGSSGSSSGSVVLFDRSKGEIRGGEFGGAGIDAGLLVAFGLTETLVFACDTGLVEGPIFEVRGLITGETPAGDPFVLDYLREPTALLVLIGECGGADEDVDTDGDGVPDAIDACPESDLRENVWVFHVETRIKNRIHGELVNAEGCSLADLLNRLIIDSKEASETRSQFLRELIIGLRDFRKEGLLPRGFFRHFVYCAARAHYETSDEPRRHGGWWSRR